MSHIATEEWQSFELRMRRRRAERMLLHAEAALDGGCPDEARTALEEARRLCPALPSLDDVEARLARAAAAVVRTPAPARMGRFLALAATLVIATAAGLIGWRFVRTPTPVASHEVATPSAAGLPAPSPVKAAPAQASPTIRVETEQVPPVVVSGSDAPSDEKTPPAAPPAPTMKSAEMMTPQPLSSPNAEAHVVGTAGATATSAAAATPPPAPVDTGINAPLGRETTLPAPDPAIERVARAADLPAAPTDAPPPPVAARAEPPAPPVAARVEPSGPPAVSTRSDDVALVRTILDKYADAYTRLDADAAKSVWPTVNRAALSRAFNGLNEQRIAFSDCSVLVHSTQARATCSGSTTWEPKIGGGARTDVRRWAFELEKSGEDWVIRDARVQNR